MADIVNWGILGASNFALKSMAPAIHAAPRGRFAALATRDPDRAAPFSAFAPDLRVHASYDALIADPQIDAVYIPLPNTLHVDWTLKAIDAGKHVLCEKPLAMAATEFDPVIAARDASDLVVAEAFMIVHHPQWHHTRDLIRDGAIGALVRAEAAFTYDNRDGANIRNRPETGGGSLPDIGVYTIGGVRFATGQEPEAAEHIHIRRENGVEVTAEACLRFPGFRLHSLTSMRMFPRQEVVLHGEEGLIRLTAPFNPGSYGDAAVELVKAGQVTQTTRFTAARQYEAQVEAFNAACLDGTAFPCPLEFSRGTQAALDMILAAEGSA